MKFRTKMILAYATIALLASLGLGIIVGKTSLRYERDSQKNNLLVSAKSCVSQMDEMLGRMDAIMSYILSDADMLESITMLAQDEGQESASRYVREAGSAVRIGMTTVYIMENSYRTVFFNQNSFLASSAVRTIDDPDPSSQRLNVDFRLEDIGYLDAASAAEGKSVIVTEHEDPWGAYDSVQVFSLMKALRGRNMGFLEVENRMEDLEHLERSDPDIRFLILVNGDELLYASEAGYGTALADSDRRVLESLQTNTVDEGNERIFAKAVSENYDLAVLAYKPESLLAEGQRHIFLISFLMALAVFGISLLMIIFWSDILTRPVRRLQEVVENTNIENLQEDRRLEADSGPDEFKELMNSFQSMTTRLDKALQNEKRAAMLQLQAQFDMLQTQVNPHFIYNVLNIISSRAVMDNDEVICEMCGSLGNMLRYSTNNKERYAPVEKELEYLNSYFYLLKNRYENRLEVSIDVDGRIGKQTIPKLTLQQIAENSIKHGFSRTKGRMRLSIVGRVQDGCWTIRVQDSGPGAAQEKIEELRSRLQEVRRDILERAKPAEMEIGGMGIANTYARCLLLYSEDLIFEMENVADGHGFAVTVGSRLKPGEAAQ